VTVDQLSDREVRLRAFVQGGLVPPRTPDSLRDAVNAMAVANLAAAPRSRRLGWWPSRSGRRPLLAVGSIAGLAIAGIAVIGLVSRPGLDSTGSTPPPGASQPVVAGPTLPPSPATPTRLESATWVDPSTIWVRPFDESSIRLSTDGGQTYSEPRPIPVPFTDLGFDFVDAGHGYALMSEPGPGAGDTLTAHLTSDGGRTWTPVRVGELPPVAAFGTTLASIHFSTLQRGVVLGTLRAEDGAVGTGYGPPVTCVGWTTSDGGRTWDELAEAPCLWGGPRWTSPEVGALVRPDERTVSVTTDGGRTWGSGPLPTDPAAEFWLDATVVDGTAIRLLGAVMPESAIGPIPLTVLESQDGGATWREADRSTGIDMAGTNALTAFDASHWLATREDPDAPDRNGSIFLETTDAGRTWVEAGRVAIGTGGGVAWADRLHGTIQGARMVAQPDGSRDGYITVWITNDGGRTWHEVPF
jgi:photosystem II stability/assembly factor-like uncharacterized protein